MLIIHARPVHMESTFWFHSQQIIKISPCINDSLLLRIQYERIIQFHTPIQISGKDDSAMRNRWLHAKICVKLYGGRYEYLHKSEKKTLPFTMFRIAFHNLYTVEMTMIWPNTYFSRVWLLFTVTYVKLFQILYKDDDDRGFFFKFWVASN